MPDLASNPALDALLFQFLEAVESAQDIESAQRKIAGVRILGRILPASVKNLDVANSCILEHPPLVSAGFSPEYTRNKPHLKGGPWYKGLKTAEDFDNCWFALDAGRGWLQKYRLHKLTAAPAALATGKTPGAPAPVYTDTQNRILEELNGVGLTAESLAKRIGLGVTTIKDALAKLKKLGAVANKRGLGYYRPDKPPLPDEKT